MTTENAAHAPDYDQNRRGLIYAWMRARDTQAGEAEAFAVLQDYEHERGYANALKNLEGLGWLLHQQHDDEHTPELVGPFAEHYAHLAAHLGRDAHESEAAAFRKGWDTITLARCVGRL